MKNEKLKLEEIVGYLPYGLKIQYGKWSDYKSERICATSRLTVRFLCDLNLDFKPILHPLEDLKKEQLSNFSVNFRMWYNKKNFNYNLMIYSDIELCHILHIDYRNLIGRGLAYNINLLKD